MFGIINKSEYFIDNEGKKTINLPNGTLKMRTTKNFKYPDHDILLEFCKERDIPVVVTEKPNLSVVKKYIKTTGKEIFAANLRHANKVYKFFKKF